MTRDEAIKYLNEFIFFRKISNTTEDEAVECFKLAIEALQQQPCEDCISRKEAIDALWKALHEYEDKTEKQFMESKELDVADWFQHRIFVQNMSDIDRQTILNLPPVNPQQKIGHWIIRRRDNSGWKDTTVYVNSEGTVTESRDEGTPCKCSECGEWLVGSDEYVCSGRFCPSCGIKMEAQRNDK